jgi:hypothetical protein
VTFKVFIYCDHPAHPGRQVPVTNFLAVNSGWHEQPASRASTAAVGTGHHLIQDSLAEPGWALDPDVSNSDIRDRFKLSCRKCKGAGGQGAVDARAETLFPVLDGLRAAGVLQIPLGALAATLSKKHD